MYDNYQYYNKAILHCTVISVLIVLLLGTSLGWKYESKNDDTTL